MSQHVSELETLLHEIPDRLDQLSQDIWESIDHDNPKSLQAGVSFKQEFNDKANRLKKAAHEFIALLDRHVEVRSNEAEETSQLHIKDMEPASNLKRLEQFLSPEPSEDNR